MNKSRLRKIAETITEEPKRFDMNTWGFVKKESELTKKDPPCGTVGCLAGWAVALFDKKVIKAARKRAEDSSDYPYGYGDLSDAVDKVRDEDIKKRAAKLLDLNEDQKSLFYEREWRSDLSEAYGNARTRRQRAAIAVKEIEHLIATGEAGDVEKEEEHM